MTDEKPDSVTEAIRDSVDLSETCVHQLEHVDGSAEVLSGPERQKLENRLSDAFPEATDQFYDLSYSWKDGSYCDDAQTLERVYDEAFDVDAPVRNGELDGRAPQRGETVVAEVLHEVTQLWLTRHHGDSLQLYRGIRTHDGLCEAVAAILDTQEAAPKLELTVLSNFTLDRRIADYYGTLVIKTVVEPDRVALAADSLLPAEGADGIADHEAEMRVFGSSPERVRADNLLLSKSDRSLMDSVTKPKRNSPDEHDVVAGVVNLIADNAVRLSQEASERLTEWYEVFLKRSPEAALALRDDLAAVLHENTDPP